MRARNATLAAVLAAILPSQGTAQDDYSFERFALFNECEPMALLVESLSSDAAEIALTRERIQTLAESRLRAARLFSDNLFGGPYLYVQVSVSRRSFSLSLEYHPGASTT